MPQIRAKAPVAECLVRSFPGLPPEDRNQLQELALILRYGADELVAQEGSYCSGIYVVCQGLVAIGKYAGAQERRLLRFLAPGEW
ncbi:MAG: hypothetical protein ACP5G2_06630 [Candidatus Bipolaricaulaceae bacterium]